PETSASTNSATWALLYFRCTSIACTSICCTSVFLCHIACITLPASHCLCHISSGFCCSTDFCYTVALQKRRFKLYRETKILAKKTPYPTPVPPAYDPLVPSREDILSVLRQTKQPLSPEDLAAHFDVSVESIGFNRRLSAMERDGQLSSDKKGMLRLASTQHFIPGKVQGH